MILDIILFILGLVAIIKGADIMTDGAAAVAHRFGIPTMVIGMTIIAIGSSAPEFVVSALASFHGNTDMAIGNVVGSNIFNILAIIGVTSLLAPITASPGNIRNDVPFVVLSSLVIAITALDEYINPGSPSEISRSEGLLLLCMFAIFLSYTFAMARGGKAEDSESTLSDSVKNMKMWKATLFIIGGLASLVIGGNLLVNSASSIATQLGVSQSIIALTIVSIGTSLPELAASAMAARKGDTAMALGNVVGSAVFNVFFVLGVSATIAPLSLGNITVMDIGTLVFASCLFWLFSKTHLEVKRWEGAILLIVQVLYYIYLTANATTEIN